MRLVVTERALIDRDAPVGHVHRLRQLQELVTRQKDVVPVIHALDVDGVVGRVGCVTDADLDVVQAVGNLDLPDPAGTEMGEGVEQLIGQRATVAHPAGVAGVPAVIETVARAVDIAVVGRVPAHGWSPARLKVDPDRCLGDRRARGRGRT